MTRITYEIVEHDGGWAYKMGGVLSEPFPSHDAARKAAERAAREQVLPGESTDISYEDKDGRWRRTVVRFRPAGDGRRGVKGRACHFAEAINEDLLAFIEAGPRASRPY